jgi:PKD repeat protein
MKTITSRHVMQLLLTFFLVLVFHGTAQAQSGTYITWNNEVGCISYDSQGDREDPKKPLVLLEEIEDGPCIKVCENNTVSYVVNGTNITNVQWSAAGGTITSIGGTANRNASIQWGSAGSGAIDVTIFYSDNTQKKVTLCIEKINGPRARFRTYGAGENTFCLNTPINFENLSINNGGSDIVNYTWYFGDHETSYAFEPTHSYDLPGTYTVTLEVTNNCSCTSKYEMQIVIEERPNVTINCPSVVCENDQRQTYWVDNDCGGAWEVEGGTIVGQTATSVDVVWDHVSSEGFGFVSYKSECTCPFWTTVKIPVVKRSGTIEGDTTICVGDQEIYSLPQWPSTDFVWTLNPSSSSGTHLVQNDQRNQIIVDALAPGVYSLICEYTNTLLGCSGTASTRIIVTQGAVITSAQPDQFCANSGIKTYSTTSGTSYNWVLTRNNTTVATSTGTGFSYNFTAGGVYTLNATLSGGCPGQPKVITVTPTPATPTGPFVGETRYCINNPYEYSLTNTVPNTVLEWSVTGGAIQGDNTGNNVTIVFNNATNATISVVRRSLDGLSCVSAPLTLTVTRIIITGTVTPSVPTTVFCPSSQNTFNANVGTLAPDALEWSVIPANFGSIISGGNGSTVTVGWNEISSPSMGTGTLRLRIFKCGTYQDIDTPITLQAAPNLTLTGPGQICYGGNVTFNLSAPGVTTGTIVWNFGNGNIQSTPINSNGIYPFTNPYNNATGTNVNYTVSATINLANGCNTAAVATTSVVVFPKTVITVSPGYNYVVCPTGSYSTVLSANATTGIGVSVTYQWFKNSAPIGTGNTYTISNGTQGTTPQGTYYVQVTDSNGCVTKSQNITVAASCVPANPCSITPNPNVVVTANWNTCNTITATVSYVGTATVQWVGSPLISLISGNNSSATFSTSIPGAHLVTANVTYQTANGPCTVQKTVEVKTHYKPDFNTNIVCNTGTGTYNVTLLNNSTVFDVANNVTYTFTLNGLNPQTGQTASYNNLLPGTYNFTLTLSMPGTPGCSVTKPITLAPMPTVNFNLTPTTYCADGVISLTIPNYNAANTYFWNFAGTHYRANSATTNISIDAGGSFPITLSATTPQGCTITGNAVQVTIIKPDYSGGSVVITPGPSFCEGTTPAPVLSFAAGSTPTPSAIVWMRGSQQVATTATYLPTVSGNYWVKLYNSQGCEYFSTTSQNVIVRQRPYAGIVGSSTVCAGEQGTVQGVVTNNALQRRWSLNGSPMAAPYGTWATTTPLTVNVPTGTGTYNFTFEVRPTADLTCGTSAALTVTVYPPVTPPTIHYTVDTCEPYRVRVDASGPAGTYNWSNGSTGQTIFVDNGGALGVTYTAPTGCTATAEVMIPQPLERSLWVFPVGCYNICFRQPVPYILGPLGTFDQYEWLINGNVADSGNNTYIPNLPVNLAGTYQLSIDNQGCSFESGIMNVSPILEGCDIAPCRFEAEFRREARFERDRYIVDGYINNPYSYPITVTITSFNNYGVYSPNTVTIPAYSTYNFSPLYFIPNASFTGGDDYIVLQMEDCLTIFPIRFEERRIEGMQARMAVEPATLSVMPNPAEDVTTITYNLGDAYHQAESLTVYNLLGTPVLNRALQNPTGEIQLTTTGLPSGTYIVSIQADGVRAVQQTLIKR